MFISRGLWYETRTYFPKRIVVIIRVIMDIELLLIKCKKRTLEKPIYNLYVTYNDGLIIGYQISI